MQLTNAEMAERLQDQEDLGISIGKAQAQARIDALEAEVKSLKTALAGTYATSFDDGLAVGRRQVAEDVAMQFEGIAAEWREKAREE